MRKLYHKTKQGLEVTVQTYMHGETVQANSGKADRWVFRMTGVTATNVESDLRENHF